MSLALINLQSGFLFSIAPTTKVVPELQDLIVKIGKTHDNKIIIISKHRMCFLHIDDAIKALTLTDCYKIVAIRL
jgi:hypothetical protein